MKKEDIIKAAFKVWGRELYRKTSLSQVAGELKVSKPALYRHFKDKEALLQAMYEVFFDDFTAFIKKDYEKAVAEENWQKRCFIVMRIIAEYYITNRDAFIFSLTCVYSRRERDKIKEFHVRGVYFEHLIREKNGISAYPTELHLIMVSMIFWIGQFHQKNLKKSVVLSGEQVKQSLAEIEDRIVKGFGLDAGKVAVLDFEKLERQIAGKTYKNTERSALLKAVAEAVAEVGPWDASMEMVARYSGLSKSGLYAHFKNKQDMLGKLFITEFSGLISYAKKQVETTHVPEEQLYLGIISIVDYLRSRPEFILALEWLKTRQLDLKKMALKELRGIIGSMKLEAIKQYNQDLLILISQWLIFMVVSVLVWRPSQTMEASGNRSMTWTKTTAEIPDESFRTLFRFTALGLEGLNL